MIAALFVANLTAPTITEITPPRGWTPFINLAVSPKGELAYLAERGDESNVFVWRDGKNTHYRYADNSKFGLEEMAAQDSAVLGFSPDGSFFGYRVFAYNGASSTWMSRPLVGKDGQIKPMLLPKELKGWNDLDPVAVRPDGAYLIEGVEAVKNTMMGDPKLYIDRLLWIKDGQLIAEVGKASNPVLDSQGRIVAATQFVDEDGDITGQSIYNRRAHVVVMKGGKFERVTDGEVIGLLSSGDLVIKRSVFSDASQQYDQPDKMTFHLLRGADVLDLQIPGLPSLIREIFIGADGRGMVHGWEGDEEVLRSFTRTGFQNVPLPIKEIDLDAYVNGWFALSYYDAEGGADCRLFLGRL